MGKNILDFLNANSGSFSVLFAFLVAFATIVYAILTAKLVSETIKLRKAQTEPNVCAYVQIMSGWYPFNAFVIENIGMGPAKEIKLSVKRDFEIDNEKVSELSVIKNGINYLAPNQKIIPFSFFMKRDEPAHSPLELVITFKSSLDESYKNEFQIFMDRNLGITELQKSDYGKMEYEIKELKNSLHLLARAISELKRS